MANQKAGISMSEHQLPKLIDQALTLHRAGQFDQAQSLYNQILEVFPSHADALHMSGLLAQQRGDHELALQLINAAIRSAPDSAKYVNLAMLHHALGHADQALACLHQALVLKPDNAIAYNNLGTVLQGQGKLPAAMESYLHALACQPDYAHAFNNLGSVAHDLGNLKEAVECYQQALALDPDYAMAHNNYGNAMRDLARPAEAIDHFKRSIALDPGYAMAYNNLGNILRDQGDGKAAIASFRKALELDPSRAEVFSNVLLTMQSMAGVTPQQLFAEHLRFAEQYETPLRAQWKPHANGRDPARRLKIGFVSGDFRDHPLMYFFEPVLAEIDKNAFEIFCYYNHHVEDAASLRIASHAEHWIGVRNLSDEAMAQRVRDDGIDILVDLSGHTAYNRLLVFARKPAPVQITWIGYQSTTGLAGMDYRLTDAALDPPGMTEAFHSETVLRIASSAPFRPSALCPPINRLPALSSKWFTLACLNQLTKISPEAIAVWAKIMSDLPNSRMILGNINDDETRKRLLALFAAHGIEAGRLLLYARLPMADYLALHLEIDLGLDSFPYNGGTTTSHAISMGVPVVTLGGDTPISRAGMATVGNVGLYHFVARSPEEYVAYALAAAADLPALDALRQVLRDRITPKASMEDQPVARHFEAAMRVAWKNWCETK